MPDIIVILDTNALFGDPFWTRSSTRKLLSLGREADVEIVIPEIVLRELNRQATKEVLVQQRSLTTAWGGLFPSIENLGLDAAQLGLTREKPEKFSESKICSAIETKVNEILADARISVLPLPEVGHEEILRRDFSGRKPFDQNGRGYRDTLIWHSILEFISARTECQAYLVCADNDFGSKGSLDQGLISELPPSCSMSRVTTIDELLGTAAFVEIFARRELEEYQQSLDEVVAEAVTAAIEELDDHPLSFEDCESLGIPAEISDVSVSWPSTESDQVEWAPYESLDGTTILGEASAPISFSIVGNLIKHDFGVLADDRVSILDLTDDFAQVSITDLEGRVVFAVRAELPNMVETEFSRFDFHSTS